VKTYTRIWVQFYEAYIKFLKEKTFPVYFLRFEDLVFNRENVMKEVLAYSMGLESIEGTYIEKRIIDVSGNKEKVT
jgi:hypothetical protein